jgi:catechol 2,3-dioxygenase-like lactoylglutathione lyase family enzyme
MRNGFHHVGLTVADIARSARFYARLGFTPERPTPMEFNADWIKTMTGLDDAHVLIAHLQLDSTVLELLQYLAPTGAKSATLANADAGSAHIAVGTNDLSREYERLKSRGVAFRSPPITVPDGPLAGGRAVYAADPDGNTVELVEWLEPRPKLTARDSPYVERYNRVSAAQLRVRL